MRVRPPPPALVSRYTYRQSLSMRHLFYDSLSYRATQASLTKRNQDKGIYRHLIKRTSRLCARQGCGETFTSIVTDPKQYCSRSCAAKVNNSKRIWSEEVKKKIALSMFGKPHPLKGILKVPRHKAFCANPNCGKEFAYERHRTRKFCSNSCLIQVIGHQTTSPKASRGKAGIRPDISSSIYFYSRWEANIARLYTFLRIQWVYAPTSFDIGNQVYTPDFYLPETDTYVEVKNFMGEYSKKRDFKFRQKYPHLRLEMILKEAYLELEKNYSSQIAFWEYKNSKFEHK